MVRIHSLPPPCRCISLVLSIEFSNRICNFLLFFFFFLSMEFIAELPYKSPRLSGCFHTFSFLTIILKTFQDPTTATVTRSSKTYNRVNIKKNFALQPLFCTLSLPSLHIYDAKMPNFMLYDEIFLFFLNVHMDL